MVVIGMVLKEIVHRKVNFLLAVLAVATATAFYIAFQTAARASERETARLMLSMGYNLHIIAKEANVGKYLMENIPDATMPQEYLNTLALQRNISYNHVMATLDGKVTLRGVEVILTGISPEVSPPNQKKPPMTFEVKPGTAYVGYRVAQALGIEKGQTIELGGMQLQVERCLAESGGTDDMRIQCSLQDAQTILGLPGRVSQIKAVDCLCFAPGDPLEALRKEIGAILPEGQVLQAKSIASARARQRQMLQKLFSVMLPFVLAACGIWVAVLAIMNVRDRQQEIGLLRALGYGAGNILLLFLGKAVLVGLFGAVAGFAMGTGLGLWIGPAIFELTARIILQPEMSLLYFSCIVAPLFAILASFVPAMIAVTYDPATTLREE
jgi:putative ABC transport system permease protein